jgi:hypothetical protein
VALVVVPLLGLAIRVPWGRIGEAVSGEAARAALRLSILVASAAALLSLAGFPLAWVLARTEFRGKTLVRAAVVLPLVMPPVVAARPCWPRSDAEAWLAPPCSTGSVSRSPSRRRRPCSPPPSSLSRWRCSRWRRVQVAGQAAPRTRLRLSALLADTSSGG